jgi:hypothetical protein
MRRARPWVLALAASLLLHAVLFGGLAGVLPVGQPAAAPAALEVTLAFAPPPPVAPPAPAPARPPAPRPARSAPTVAAPPPEVATAEPASAAPEAAAPAQDDAAAAVLAETPDPAIDAGADPGVEPEPPQAAEPAPPQDAEPAPPPLNPLPPRLDLRYQLRYGVAGGEQTLVWLNEGDRYTLTSVAAATGLTGLFYRGRFVQTSRGRITPRGLQPEEFWDQRGDRHSRARFDAAHGEVALTTARGEPRTLAYQGDAQDALSLFFQLALTAPPPAGEFAFTVFNGKKIRVYRYVVHGETMLDTELGALRTLHLERVGQIDGRFEAWLAPDRQYLPVRVLRSDDQGNAMELRVLSITP